MRWSVQAANMNVQMETRAVKIHLGTMDVVLCYTPCVVQMGIIAVQMGILVICQLEHVSKVLTLLNFSPRSSLRK